MGTFDPNLVLYIPYIDKKWANVYKITRVFENLNIGIIKKVDLIISKKIKDKIIYEGFIHFNKWFDSIQNRNIQDRIFNNTKAKIVYDDPNYWILMKSKNIQPIIKNTKKKI